MDDAISTYIANEEAKIKALRDEADSRSRNLDQFKAAYRNMQGPDVIDLNARVRPVAQGRPVVTPPQEAQTRGADSAQSALNLKADWPTPAKLEEPQGVKRQVHKPGQVKRAILNALSREPKHLGEIGKAVTDQGCKISHNHVRTELWNMKNEGLTESPEKGYYRITGEGEAFLERQKGESPGATGLSSATVSASDLA